MTQQKIDWETFVARRRLDVSAWLKSNGLTDYESVVKKCELLGVSPPKQLDFPSPEAETVVVEEEVVEENVSESLETVVEDSPPAEELVVEEEKPSRRRKKKQTDESE